MPKRIHIPARRSGFRLLGIAVMTGSLLPAMAEDVNMEPETELQAVRVTATRSTIDMEDTPRSISIIEKEQIEKRPGTSGIQPLLAETPGISFSRTGGLGGAIMMRGMSSATRHSALAIDGDRMRGRSVLDYNLIDPNSIERIEIIRGPASALWGSDAMNGLVNVVTRRTASSLDEPFSMKAHIRALDYNSGNNMYGTRAELAGSGAGFDVLIGAYARNADDYYTPEGRALNSDFRTRGTDFRLGFSPTHETRFELAGRYQQVTTGRAGGMGAAPGVPHMTVREDPIQEQYLKLGVQTANVGQFADLLEGSLYVRKLRTDVYTVNAVRSPPNTAHALVQAHEPTVFGGRINATRETGNHLLSYGVDFYREDFGPRYQTSRVQAPDGQILPPSVNNGVQMDRGSKQSNIGVYASDEWKVDPALVLSGALRFDYVHTKFDSTGPVAELPETRAAFARRPRISETALTGNIGAVFKLSPTWSIPVQISRAFRAPSGFEYTATTTFGTLSTPPSPDLAPEYSTTYEAGLRYHAKGLRINTTAYLSNYRDLIYPRQISPSDLERANIGKARIYGLEADGEWHFARSWSARFAVTKTHATDRTSNAPLEGVPDIFGNIALRYEASAGHWHADGAMRAANRRSRLGRDINNRPTERPRAGYALFDLYAGLDFGKIFGPGARGWKLVAGIENILNKAVHNQAAAENVNYPRSVGNPLMEPGRTFVIRLLHS